MTPERYMVGTHGHALRRHEEVKIAAFLHPILLCLARDAQLHSGHCKLDVSMLLQALQISLQH